MTRADVTRYIFIAVDLHHLLLAGLPAHPTLSPDDPLKTFLALVRTPAPSLCTATIRRFLM